LQNITKSLLASVADFFVSPLAELQCHPGEKEGKDPSKHHMLDVVPLS